MNGFTCRNSVIFEAARIGQTNYSTQSFMTRVTDHYSSLSVSIDTSDRLQKGEYNVRLSNNYLDYEDHRSGDVYSSVLFNINIYDCPTESITRTGGAIPR